MPAFPGIRDLGQKSEQSCILASSPGSQGSKIRLPVYSLRPQHPESRLSYQGARISANRNSIMGSDGEDTEEGKEGMTLIYYCSAARNSIVNNKEEQTLPPWVSPCVLLDPP